MYQAEDHRMHGIYLAKTNLGHPSSVMLSPYSNKNSTAISKFTPFDAIQLTLKISPSLHLEVNTDHERLTSAGSGALPRS